MDEGLDVPIVSTALWRRLDTPGHDACFLEQRADGWRVEGTAVFRHPKGPAMITYRVDCNADWKTVAGSIRGVLGVQRLDYDVVHRTDGWTLSGTAVRGLDHLVDLDLGFTPATNLQQLRRVPIARGDCATISVAWLDFETGELIDFEQRYERRSASTFWYEAPSVGYAAMLEIAPDGFIRHYPDIWEAEPPA